MRRSLALLNQPTVTATTIVPTSNGLVLGHWPSPLGEGDVMAVVTGFDEPTANGKTGVMLQVWILPYSMNPVEAIETGEDEAVCGNCPFRDGSLCYVTVHFAPRSVYATTKRGGYARATPPRLEWFRGALVRWGAWGDPVCIPEPIMRSVNEVAAGWTGYTHQWRDPRFAEYKRWLCASVESEKGYRLAQADGWRTFRVRQDGSPLLKGEFECPASKEKGHVRTCATCLACDGHGQYDTASRASASIILHGGQNVTWQRLDEAIRVRGY